MRPPHSVRVYVVHICIHYTVQYTSRKQPPCTTKAVQKPTAQHILQTNSNNKYMNAQTNQSPSLTWYYAYSMPFALLRTPQSAPSKFSGDFARTWGEWGLNIILSVCVCMLMGIREARSRLHPNTAVGALSLPSSAKSLYCPHPKPIPDVCCAVHTLPVCVIPILLCIIFDIHKIEHCRKRTSLVRFGLARASLPAPLLHVNILIFYKYPATTRM